ncbi:MAG: hypothetical protein ACR2KU_13985 [Gammaproteobacteria bacterium]
MSPDTIQAFLLLAAPLGGLAVKEVSVDPPIELVDVHRIDALLHSLILGLNSADRIVMVLPLVVVADPQGL